MARDLLGAVLVRRRAGDETTAGRIVEVEAYCGAKDLAAHSARGRRTARNDVMYGPGGHAYVYFIYGMYYCLNVVTERTGFPAAVLFRALEPSGKIALPPMSGPGRLCRALAIDLALNRADFTKGPLGIEDRGDPPPAIGASPRIGVEYAGEWARKPWRFFIEGSPAVTKPRPPRRPS